MSYDKMKKPTVTGLEDNSPVEPPIYRQTAQYAREHGERDEYFASRKVYENCRAAITDSINSHFDGMHLGDKCITEVVAKFNPERVKDVLAYTVQKKDWDARFSMSNRAWANGIDTSHMGKESYQFVVESHPAVLDGFISMFRRDVLEQSQGAKSTEKAQHKPAERSDDLELG